jgi:GPH family glycoside/pentoside/hexuronide:cation symporter
MREKLPFLTKFFYGFGSLAYGIKDNAFNYFLLFVYVQVFGLAPNLAGLAILLMLVIDAISDPLIGYFSDKTQSKWGRRHPWIYGSAIPVAVSFFLIWDPPENMSQMELFWFLLLVGAFIRTAITIYEIPSNALGPELSKDYVERSSLLSYRYWFGWWGGLAVWNSLWIFVVYSTLTGTQDARFVADTWITYGLVCSPIMFIAIIVTATGTHRHIKDLHAPEIERKTIGIIFKELYETMTVSRNYIILFITPLNILTIGLSLFLAPLVGIVVSPFLANRFGKKNGALVLFAISLTVENGIIVLRLLGLLPENGSPIVLAGVLVFHFIGVATSVISFTTLNSMVWDTVEEVEIKTGRRMEGTLLAARSFAQKCMSGAGAFAAGMILTFAAWPENAVPGKVDPEILFTFGLTAVTASVILWAISLFTISFVTTTRESHEEKLNELNYVDS